MGYYSHVTLAMYENDFQSLVQKAQQENLNAFDLLKHANLYKNEDIITISWECIKWYDGNGVVSFIESFMRSGIQYSFKRVGEESGDIHEEQEDDEWILSDTTRVECYIETDTDTIGDHQNTEDYISKCLSVTQPNEDDDSVEEVSEAELLDVIGA